MWGGEQGAWLSRARGGGLTFIMSTMVLRAIMAMMVYSKGGDTTNCHMRYWKLCLFCGMCRVRGLALMAKSMHALCGRVTPVSQAQIPQTSHPGGLSVRCLGEEDSVEEARTGQAEVKVAKEIIWTKLQVIIINNWFKPAVLLS